MDRRNDTRLEFGALLGAGGLAAMLIAGAAGPSVAQSPAGEIEYAIWGDPAELTNQIALVDAFMAQHPDIAVKVTVSDWDAYWDKLQTGLAGGDAPDVFAMDGPLFPDYQSRGVLLELAPYIERDAFDLTALADAGVAHFTTADGQYGLPRDLNVVALYYNKAMFDAAGLAYPDETWTWETLVENGKKLTLDADGDGQPEQWGFYTETSDMENYWSSLVWQNGGEIVSQDRTQTLLGSDQAVGGIQQLQDLVYTHKVMPPPELFVEIGDAFEQGQAAMEANGSWLVPTHLAAGIDLGIAPLPAGPAGQATSINPTGVVVAQSSKNPDAAWEFVKYLVGPEAQEQLMQLKAAVPVDKSVLAGDYATAFPGSDVFARSIEFAHLKPSFRGYSEWSTVLQGELDQNVFNQPNATARQAIDAVLPQLDQILADNARVTLRRAPAAVDVTAGAPGSPQGGTRKGGGPLASERRWAWVFLAPMLVGLAVLSAGPILATLGISFTEWDLLTPPKLVGLDNFADLLANDRFWIALRNTIWYTVLSVPIGMVLALLIALGLDQAIRGHRVIRTMYFLPLVTSSVAVGLVWLWIYAPTGGLLNEFLGWAGVPPQRWTTDPFWAMPAIVVMSVWQSLGINIIIFLAGLQAIPREYHDAANVDGAGRRMRFRHITLPLLTPSIFFTGILALIGSLQVFDQVYVLARPGKPTEATITLVYFIYEEGFRFFRMGMASAAAWILFLIAAALTIVYFWSQRRWVHYQ